jgi:hypothetical protein
MRVVLAFPVAGFPFGIVSFLIWNIQPQWRPNRRCLYVWGNDLPNSSDLAVSESKATDPSSDNTDAE